MLIDVPKCVKNDVTKKFKEMKKDIVFLIAFITTLFVSCTQDEMIYNEEIEQREMIMDKKSTKHPLAPEIVPDQIVIQFKKKGLEEYQKEKIRGDVQNKYFFRIKKIEKCDCDDDRIELWTMDISNEYFIGIEDLVSELSTDDDGEEDLNGDYQFSITIENVDKKVAGKDIIEITERVLPKNAGDRVNIAIIDTGIDYDYFSTPFLYNSSGDNSNCYSNEISGWDFVNNDNDPRDDHAHGTLVYEIIREILTEKKINHQILPVKAFDKDGKSDYFKLSCAFKYIASKQKPFLVNCSFGFYNLKNQNIIENIIRDNSDKLLVMASAGNEGVDTDATGNEHFPSSYTAGNILTVGGYTGDFYFSPQAGSRYVSGFDVAPESNFGNNSIDVVSLFKHEMILKATDSSHVLKATVKGTSFACPIVTARAARVYAKNPMVPTSLRYSVLETCHKNTSLRNKIRNSTILVKGYFFERVNYNPPTSL